MTHLDHEAVAAVRIAQFIVINAKWHICEEQAVARLAGVRGLACTPLFPGHAVIQVVACDGRLLGRARLHHSGRTARWIAVPTGTAHEIGAYRTLHGAARALARHTGVRHLRTVQSSRARPRRHRHGSADSGEAVCVSTGPVYFCWHCYGQADGADGPPTTTGPGPGPRLAPPPPVPGTSRIPGSSASAGVRGCTDTAAIMTLSGEEANSRTEFCRLEPQECLFPCIGEEAGCPRQWSGGMSQVTLRTRDGESMRSWQPLPELLEPETRRLVERLRSLKEETGMSLAELARRTAHSKSAWHRYLNGRMFPPRSAVEALARLVQADELQLVELWTHAQHVHARCESLPRQSSPAPGAPSAVPTLLRRRIAVVAVLVLVAAAVAWVIAGAGPSRIASQVPVETTTASARPPGEHAAPACTGETCEGQYPAPSGCDRDARTESSVSTSGYSVQLRFSPSCGTVWAEVHSRAGRVREILIKVEPKDKLTDPPNDRFPTTSPMLATTTPQAAEACAIVEEQLACTSAGGQEISLVACPSHTDGLRSNDQCVAARPAAGLPLAGSGGTGGRRRP